MDAFDKVFKGHEDMVDKRKRGECVYCKQIGVSSKKKGYKYTHNYCATCQAYVHPTCWIKFHRCQISRSRRCIPGVMHTNLLLDMVLYVYIKIGTSLFDANSRCTRAHLFVERRVPEC